MNARLYLNSSTLSASSRIDGGGFSPPPVRAFSDVLVRFRLAREMEGESVPDDREILGVAARIGRTDAAPLAGSCTLTLTTGAGQATTEPIAHDATAELIEAALDAALAGSPLAALAPTAVEAVEEGFRIVFADPSEPVDLEAGSNRLWPLSFVDADRMEWDGGWATILTFHQAPVAETGAATVTVPPLPTVTRVQAGSTTDGVSINEIQRIRLSPGYAGATWRLVWSGRKGRLLPGFPTVEQLEEALEGLAPEGGTVNLTVVEDGVLAEFAGSMAGEGQDLLEAEEFTPPPVEHLVMLPTNTAAMRSLMAGAGTDGEMELPLDIEVTVADEDAPGGEQRMVFSMALTFSLPVSDGRRNVSVALGWTQPLGRTDNLPFSTDALLVGNRAMRFVVGDGTAESFALPHNLGSLSGSFTADAGTDALTSAEHNLHNGDPVMLSSTGVLPGGLAAGPTYYVIGATPDAFQLAATPGGAAIDLSSSGSGTHSFLVADGTTDAVMVEVWERGGDRRRVPSDGYTVERTTANSLTLSGFAATPTAGQYEALVMTAGRPASYQKHTHPIAEIDGLQAILDGLAEEIEALKAGNFGGSAPRAARLSGTIDRPLPRVWRVPKSRLAPAEPESLLGWDPFAGETPLRDVRLLPAVHAASVLPLPNPLPAVSAALRGQVYWTAAARPDFPGGGLPAGGHAACDGREWYRVERESEAESTYYPAAFGFELFRFSISPDELVARSRMELAFGFEAAVFDPSRRPQERRTVARATLLVERGVRTADVSPGNVGGNIATHFAEAVELIRHDFDLTAMPVQKRFGLSVARAGDGSLSALATKMMQAPASVSPPDTADFVLRARICRCDVANLPEDGRGVLAVRGLDVGLDGRPDPALGRLVIS